MTSRMVTLDACHSGAVGAQAWAKDPDATVLQNAMDLANVTVLASSKKGELPEELPGWKQGALAQTKERQHLGMHVNFNANLFMARH
jgi:hypothetical protein